jgi:hypothetical protein
MKSQVYSEFRSTPFARGSINDACQLFAWAEGLCLQNRKFNDLLMQGKRKSPNDFYNEILYALHEDKQPTQGSKLQTEMRMVLCPLSRFGWTDFKKLPMPCVSDCLYFCWSQRIKMQATTVGSNLIMM